MLPLKESSLYNYYFPLIATDTDELYQSHMVGIHRVGAQQLTGAVCGSSNGLLDLDCV